jgi:mycofactocin precursor
MGLEEVLNDMEEKEKEKEKEVEGSQNDGKGDDIFKTEEVKIEEMAIDGICGVY